MSAEQGHKTRVVILGGGFGGAWCAQRLERNARRHGLEVALIDRRNFLLFYPLLAEACAGELEPRHVVAPLRNLIPKTDFRLGDVIGVDPQKREVVYRVPEINEERSLTYDHLVVAVGSVSLMPKSVEGLRERGRELKNLADSVALRDQAVRMLEIADGVTDPEKRRELLSFAVVGGSYTGVEVAGELLAMLREAAERYPNLSPAECRVTLIEMRDRILPTLSEKLANYAADNLRRRGLELFLGKTVAKIGPDSYTLSDGSVHPARTVVWCAGVAPNPLLAKLGLPLDAKGYLDCDRTMRVKGFENVWAIGDCAACPGPDGKPYPPTAQHATRLGTDVADNILRAIHGRELVETNIRNRGMLAAMGQRTAVAEVFGINISGFLAWFLWRSLYLLKMPGIGRKLRVALDWTAGLVCERDLAQLGVHRPRAEAELATQKPAEKNEETSAKTEEGPSAMA